MNFSAKETFQLKKNSTDFSDAGSYCGKKLTIILLKLLILTPKSVIIFYVLFHKDEMGFKDNPFEPQVLLKKGTV